jgi:hypothetical protein
LAVDSEAHFGGVIVFLAVVFPPADRAELECRGRFESLRSATRATVAHFDRRGHTRFDGGFSLGITEGSELERRHIPDRERPRVCFRLGTRTMFAVSAVYTKPLSIERVLA